MMASTGLLTVMVSVALVITVAAPLLMVLFLIRDWKNGELW